MTTDMMDVCDLVEKAADADLLREMIGFAAKRLMELEVGAVKARRTARRTPPGVSSATAIACTT